MRHFHFTARGNAVNEDFVRSTSDYGIVIDGATGLAGAPLFAVSARSEEGLDALCAHLRERFVQLLDETR